MPRGCVLVDRGETWLASDEIWIAEDEDREGSFYFDYDCECLKRKVKEKGRRDF